MLYKKQKTIIAAVTWFSVAAYAQSSSAVDPLQLWGGTGSGVSQTQGQDLSIYKLPTANQNYTDEEFAQIKQRLSSKDKPVDPKSLGALKPFSVKADYTMNLASPQMARNVLQQESARLNNAPVSSIYVPETETIRKGSRGNNVRLLGEALRQLGYLQTSASISYTPDLEAALKAFQKDNGLTADGIAGKRTFAIINQKGSFRKKAIDYTLTRNVQKIPQEAKAVVVNIAAQQLRAYEAGQLVLTSKVIVGKGQYFTPEFMDTIDSITVNPTWNVPKGIASRSFRGDKVAVTAGPDNPLGKLRFNMYNKHTIYLHHTNNPSLFNMSQRAFSSGCVRVEKSYDLAIWLMGDAWYSSGVDALLQTNKTKTYPLQKKIPVYIEYRPAEVLANGQVKIWNDPYGRVNKETRGIGGQRNIQTATTSSPPRRQGAFPASTQASGFAQDNTEMSQVVGPAPASSSVNAVDISAKPINASPPAQ